MTSLLYEVFMGPDIWLPALLGFWLALIIQVMTRWIDGPVLVGRIVHRDGYAEIVIWFGFFLSILWSLGRQIYTWLQVIF